MKLTQEHEALRRTARQFVEKELNPHVTPGKKKAFSPPTTSSRKWATLAYWASASRKKTAAWGWTTPTTWWSLEELGRIACGGVPMAIGVQTDMATPP
jgi:citronellyl-CoA dehydrogenase